MLFNNNYIYNSLLLQSNYFRKKFTIIFIKLYKQYKLISIKNITIDRLYKIMIPTDKKVNLKKNHDSLVLNEFINLTNQELKEIGILKSKENKIFKKSKKDISLFLKDTSKYFKKHKGNIGNDLLISTTNKINEYNKEIISLNNNLLLQNNYNNDKISTLNNLKEKAKDKLNFYTISGQYDMSDANIQNEINKYKKILLALIFDINTMTNVLINDNYLISNAHLVLKEKSNIISLLNNEYSIIFNSDKSKNISLNDEKDEERTLNFLNNYQSKNNAINNWNVYLKDLLISLF